MDGIFRVRTSVRENLLTGAQLAEQGITNDGVAASLQTHRRGWVAERGAEIVAFSMADRQDGTLFALFVLPEYEGRGRGSRLLDLAVQWLWDNGTETAWLTTGPDTRAAGFYARRNWRHAGPHHTGDIRFELHRPTATPKAASAIS